MYQQHYRDIMEDSCSASRSTEYAAIERSVSLLIKAGVLARYGQKAIEALYFTRRLWVRFIEDLGSNRNELGDVVRANLISIGIWILQQCELIRQKRSTDFSGLISISCIIRDGLR